MNIENLINQEARLRYLEYRHRQIIRRLNFIIAILASSFVIGLFIN